MRKLDRNRQDEASCHWLVTASVKADQKLCFLSFRQSSETSMFQKPGRFKVACDLVSQSNRLDECAHIHELARRD